jgi:hypothetical protein
MRARRVCEGSPRVVRSEEQRMTNHLIATSIALIASAWLVATSAQEEHSEAVMTNDIEIPESIRREHEAIHSALVAATEAPGRVGSAARALAEVLHPHFVREEEIALPPLALLAPLAAGATLPESTRATAGAMTSELRAEMPQMLEEHVRIRSAVAELRAAAESAGADAQVELADQLALHARTEEEVLYPAALLVGDLLRSRRPQR